jgi:hypothetical protein
MSFTGGASALTLNVANYDSSLSFDTSAVLVVNQSTSGGTGATSTNGGTAASGGAANLQSTGILNLLGGSSVTIHSGSIGASTFTVNLTQAGSSQMGNGTVFLNAGTLNLSGATLDRLIVAASGTSVSYSRDGSLVPLQAILLGPNGQRVFGLESYVTSEAGQAAMAALIAQGYTVPDPPEQP